MVEEEQRLRALASPGGGPRLEIGLASLLGLVYGAASARCKLDGCSLLSTSIVDSQSPHAASAAQNAIAFHQAVACFGRHAHHHTGELRHVPACHGALSS